MQHSKPQPSSQTNQLIIRVLKMGFSFYLLCSLIYTTFDIVLKPSFNFLTNPQSQDSQFSKPNIIPISPKIEEDLYLGNRKVSEEVPQSLPSIDTDWKPLRALKDRIPSSYSGIAVENSISKASQDDSLASSHNSASIGSALPQISWHDQTFPWSTSLESSSLQISEDFFNSKVFGESLGPSKIIPYYYRATEILDGEDITIVTLVTIDRFKVLAALVENYQGRVHIS
jgi:hypothetical protein